MGQACSTAAAFMEQTDEAGWRRKQEGRAADWLAGAAPLSKRHGLDREALTKYSVARVHTSSRTAPDQPRDD